MPKILFMLVIGRRKAAGIRRKLAVLSGKGGVGKSTVTANLAVALALKWLTVGVVDLDINGPSLLGLLGLNKKLKPRVGTGIVPAWDKHWVKVVSTGSMLAEGEPVLWRTGVKTVGIEQLPGHVVWGELDFLVMDLPPGDETISLIQMISLDGVIVVTIPSEISQVVVKRAVTLVRTANIPIIGIVENMSASVLGENSA